MAKIEDDTALTPEQIEEYASKPFYALANCSHDSAGGANIYMHVNYTDVLYKNMIDYNVYNKIWFLISNGYPQPLWNGNIWRGVTGVLFEHTQRVIGLITNDNSDGSYEVAILGNETIDTYNHGGVGHNHISVYITDFITNQYPAIPEFPLSVGQNKASFAYYDLMEDGTVKAPSEISTDHSFTFLPYKRNAAFGVTLNTGSYNGNDNVNTAYFTLTDNKNTTLTLGKAKHYNSYVQTDDDILSYTDGNMFDNMMELYNVLKSGGDVGHTSSKYRSLIIGTPHERDTDHAFNIQYYNLILTRDEDAAKKYLEDGTIPSDAVINIDDDPYNPKPKKSEDEEGDEGKEDGDNDRETDPTPTVEPAITPQQISGTNIYWLQAGQLQSFITWFWTQAGDIATVGELWEKIQGLYENLSQTVLSVRYMPIKPEWVGGTEAADSIIVGNISMEMNGVTTIGAGKPIVRDIGSITIDEKYKSFCDYSPYSQLSLYLPFVGFFDLDNDMFMGHTLDIKAVYDIMSGTIQYFIYCDDYMVNSTIGKISVGIPITLQSKNDRNNAVISNVSSLVTGLVTMGSAGVGAIGGEVTASAIASVSHGANAFTGQQGAPMRVTGNVGETGAFYSSQKCAIYLRRPSYNRPDNYGKHVGYPCNKKYKLSDLKGYTVLSNPILTFNDDIKPLQSEIDEIYTQLERGVYL